MTLTVRLATESDAYPLWIWANEAEARLASWNRQEIPWPDHRRWLTMVLGAADRLVLVAETEDGQPIGTVRFDPADDALRLSYAIAPEARGRGYAGVMVTEALTWLRATGNLTPIIAVVAPGNERSLRVFRRLGWAERIRTDDILFSNTNSVQ